MIVYVVTQNWDYEGAATIGVAKTQERAQKLAEDNHGSYLHSTPLKWVTLTDPDYTVAQYDKGADYTVTRFEVVE